MRSFLHHLSIDWRNTLSSIPVLEEWQTKILDELDDWIKAFSDVQSSNARCVYMYRAGIVIIIYMLT